MVVLIAMRARYVALAFVSANLVVLAGASPASQTTSPRVIEVTAERFEFWPSEITVREGEAVELWIRSEDTMHGFRIVGRGTNVFIPKRGKGHVTVQFSGDKPGRYTFECSRMCGAGHHFMRGTLVVRPAPSGAP
jgi:cytochrome c oxidase subunit 2